MGAPSNSNTLFLQTAAPVYGASELVEGQAVLKLVAPLNVTAVELSVYGHESVGWEEGPGKEPKLQEHFSPSQLATPVDSQQAQQQPPPSATSKASTHMGLPRHGRRQIFNVCIPLLSGGPRVLQPGSYSLPFKLQLPADLPGTFRLKGAPARTVGGVNYRGISGEVSYGMQVEVRQQAVGGAPAEEAQQPAALLRASCELVITQRPEAAAAAAGATAGPSSLSPQQQAQQQAGTAGSEAGEAAEAALPCDEAVAVVPSFFFCCARAGRVTVRLRPGRDAYVAGEAAEVVVEVDNRSSQEFRDVRLEVERRLSLVSNGGSSSSESGGGGGGGSAGSSGSGSISALATEAAAAAAATAGMLTPGCFMEEERIFKSKSTASILPGACYLGANALRLPVPLPSNTPPSTCGALVRCSYTATVEVLPLSATALRGASPPRVRVPLTVFAPTSSSSSSSAAAAAAAAAARRQQQQQGQQQGQEAAKAHVVLGAPVEVVIPLIPRAASAVPGVAVMQQQQKQNGARGANPAYAGP
ncbi:hypothetical protein HYH02_013919 [Chlamydomonas schloesseri]|uniref:Arrestin-like N-terminal domain-containing protein n=1 Tax=Chlamydomonas schloesseri TaxID=2026947 RepID=A0A835SMU0_9CHLO|nr:hypothetical protein HYH02_013919 [Chlamydomonas schloesseri]|eukprot:KAG2429968.1 hypothetical protein HYH02_013919 [Chlamydomonas schloesseri]